MTDINLLQKGDLAASDFSNDDTNNKGGVKVKLSPDGGNLLQKRNNGLYYGIEAPPDTRNLYVSSSTGSDSNKGTRAEPIQTIREAFRRNSPQSRFTVHLLETDEHELKASWGAFMNGYYTTFAPYGPEYSRVSASLKPGSSPVYPDEVVRPTIKLVADRTVPYGGGVRAVVTLAAMGDFSFNAIKLDLTATHPDAATPAHTSSSYLFSSSTTATNLKFYGCTLVAGENFQLSTGTGNCEIAFYAPVVEGGSNKLLTFWARSSCKLIVDALNRTTGDIPTKDGYPQLHVRPTSTTEQMSNVISGMPKGTYFDARVLTDFVPTGD